MILYSLVVLGLLAGIQAQEPCSKQLELEHRCITSVESSPEADTLRARKKEIIKTCAPNLPEECHAQCEATHDCAMSIAKTKDSDPLFAESKPKTQAAVDQCFAKYPPDVHKGLEEIFMSGFMKPHHGMHKGRWGHKNETESEGTVDESSSEEGNDTDEVGRKHHGGGGRGGGGRGHGGHGGRGGGGRGGHGRHGKHCHHGGRHGGGGRGGHGGHHGPKLNATSSSSSESNETSGESSGQTGDKSNSGSKEKGDKSQCRKTKEQWKCIKAEFKKLANDTTIITSMNNLIRQKKKCKQIADWSCSPKCPKKQKCIFRATKPCRDVFMTRMKECLQQKGFTLPPFMLHGEEGTGIFTTPLSVTTP